MPTPKTTATYPTSTTIPMATISQLIKIENSTQSENTTEIIVETLPGNLTAGSIYDPYPEPGMGKFLINCT